MVMKKQTNPKHTDYKSADFNAVILGLV